MKIKSLILTLALLTLSIQGAVASGVSLKIRSDDINPSRAIDEKFIFNSFGCKGENLSPQISWINLPPRTQSLALTVFDLDAPTGSGWWHWVLLNIPISYKEIPRGFGTPNRFTINDGISQVRNDYSAFSYGGPCPPVGDKKHRYVFTIYALDTDKINLSDNASSALASFMIRKHTIAKSSIEAFYQRLD